MSMEPVSIVNDTYNMTSSNDTRDVTPEKNLMYSLLPMVVFITLYSVIFLVGVCGNSLVVYVVVRNKEMQSVTNIFITNLAISDISLCLISVPMTPASFYMDNWIFGEALCHLVPMVLGVNVYVSTFTCTAIAIERYFAIVYPLRPPMNTYGCLMRIAVIWFISTSLALPLGIFMRMEEINGYVVCKEMWPHKSIRRIFTQISLGLQYLVPSAIIINCYSQVSQVVRRRLTEWTGVEASTRERDEIEIKRTRRINSMLIAMVSIFVCCWLPLNLVLLIAEYNRHFVSSRYYVLIFFVSHIIATSSATYNPFLYALMTTNFRKYFKRTMQCACR